MSKEGHIRFNVFQILIYTILKGGVCRAFKSENKIFCVRMDHKLYLILVVVSAFFRVMLKEGFMGICTGFFPQYLTRAILDGQVHPTLPSRPGACITLDLICFFINQILVPVKI